MGLVKKLEGLVKFAGDHNHMLLILYRSVLQHQNMSHENYSIFETYDKEPKKLLIAKINIGSKRLPFWKIISSFLLFYAKPYLEDNKDINAEGGSKNITCQTIYENRGKS